MVQVKLFDFEHEQDLEEALNDFLKTINENQLININYQVAVEESKRSADTIFCFSAMVVYKL